MRLYIVIWSHFTAPLSYHTISCLLCGWNDLFYFQSLSLTFIFCLSPRKVSTDVSHVLKAHICRFAFVIDLHHYLLLLTTTTKKLERIFSFTEKRKVQIAFSAGVAARGTAGVSEQRQRCHPAPSREVHSAPRYPAARASNCVSICASISSMCSKPSEKPKVIFWFRERSKIVSHKIMVIYAILASERFHRESRGRCRGGLPHPMGTPR